MIKLITYTLYRMLQHGMELTQVFMENGLKLFSVKTYHKIGER